MFEKITSAAERLTTNVSESRRGFLVRLGQAALGVAGVVAGVLALAPEAHAARSGYCIVGSRHGSLVFLSGNCVCANPCGTQPSARCRGVTYYLGAICGYQ